VTKVLLASRVQAALRVMQHCLNESGEFEVHLRTLSNGHPDVLFALDFQPDIVILRFGVENLDELAAWTAKDAAARPPLIVVGPAANAEAMRMAIRSGAKDFLPEPLVAADLIAAVRRVRDEAGKKSRTTAAGSVIALVGAAGGAGTSFLAANVARVLVGDATSGSSVPVLVDLDLNFASLSHYLDIHPERGLLEALDALRTPESVDELALAGFGASHRSGLRLMCTIGGTAVLSKDVAPERLLQLIDLLAAHHSHVIVDLPHVLDGLTATVLSRSSRVAVVLQQSLLHVRNAARLLQILKNELGVAPDRFRVVVNRFQKEALVQLDDIRRSLGSDAPLTVPSHYRRALESSNTGVPLYDADRRSPVARALRQLASALSGEREAPRASLLRRVFRLSPGSES
jgi:pilus assembly protein CpaE